MPDDPVTVRFTVTIEPGEADIADVVRLLELELSIDLLKLRAFERITSWDRLTGRPAAV